MNTRFQLGWILKFAATLLVLAALPLSAQDDISQIARALYENSSNSAEKLSASFDINGNLVCNFVVRPGLASDGSLAFLESNSLWEELTLTERQESELKRRVTDWRRNHNKLREKISEISTQDNFDARDFERLVSAVSQCHLDGWQEVEQVLLPHQLTALSQIQLRFYLRTCGLLMFLQDKEIATHVGIGNNDVNRLRTFLSKEKSKLLSQTTDARLKATDIALEMFDQEAKEKIFAKWPYLEANDSDYAEQFRIHLNLSEGFDQNDKQTSVFRQLSRLPRFEMSVAGTLEPVEPRKDVDTPAAEMRNYVSIFHQLYRSRDLARVLDLNDFQSESIASAIEDYSRDMQEATSKSFQWSKDSGVSLADNRAEVNSIRETAISKCKRVIDSTLSDHQREVLEKTCRSILERNAGPFWDIRSSTLSQELGVTDATRAALDRGIGKARESFEKRLCELERDWLEQAFEVLDEPARKKLSRLLGRPLMHNPPNMYVYLSGQ